MQALSTPGFVGQYRREDMQLVVQSGAVLPSYCVKTGEPVSEEGIVTRKITWSPLWVLLIFFLSPLIGLIVYFIVRKKCEITFGLSPAIQSKYRTRRLIALAVALACFVGIFVGASMDNVTIIMASVIFMLMAIVVAIVGNAPLTAANHVNGRFWIKGFTPEFFHRIDP